MVLGTLALALVAIIYIMTRTPEMRTLFANLPEAGKAAVVEALQAANFDPAVDSLTGSVQVPAGDYHKARMMLAGQGLPHSAPEGYELLNDMPLGASRRSEEHTSELQSLMRISYAVFCLKKKNNKQNKINQYQ